MNAAEHFRWSVERAMEYVRMGDAACAMSSLVSDLSNHLGTAHIMTPDLQMLAIGETLIGGARALGNFIEGIPAPRGESS